MSVQIGPEYPVACTPKYDRGWWNFSLTPTSSPCSLAWVAFGTANGAHSAQEMRTRIAKYRKKDPNDRSDFSIGCRILTQPFFLEESDWIPVPASWSMNIVTLKTYNTDNAEGLRLWEAINYRQHWIQGSKLAEKTVRYGKPHLIRPRLGQGAFRVLVTDAYGRRCAVTQERTLPALEAAHIRPYSDGGEHEAHNGLLLCRDIHKLFDTGYVTVTPDLNFEVSQRIKEDYENGRDYYALHGKQIAAPVRLNERPDRSVLAWHK